MTNPHLPSWNKEEAGVVPVAMSTNCSLPYPKCLFHDPRVISPVDAAHQDTGWRNRSAGVVDLDDMIGEIFRGTLFRSARTALTTERDTGRRGGGGGGREREL